jgi:hypothetical protein
MKFFTKFRPRANPAESLIETVSAITVIAIVTVSAMMMIRTSLLGNEVIGEKVIAINLAAEAVEAVKNIRDTNYLRLAADPDACWYALDAADVSECEAGAEMISETNYYLERNTNPMDTDNVFFEWNMVEALDVSRAARADAYLTLYEYDASGGAGSNIVEIYMQSGIPAISSFTEVEGTVDSFQRYLTVSNLDTSSSFDLTVTVNWMVDDVEKSLSLTRTISHVY